jgi:hypothetical protein
MGDKSADKPRRGNLDQKIPGGAAGLHWEMEADGLVEMKTRSLKITEKGRPFVRNICMAFDLKLQRQAPETKLFSMTI